MLRGATRGAAGGAQAGVKLADPAALVVIAMDGTELVGMALAEAGRADDGASLPLPARCSISMVFVHPHHRGKAIGHDLLTAIDTYAAGQGIGRLQLWTGEHNERAQRLYRRAGVEPTGRCARRTHRPADPSSVPTPGGPI